MTRDAASAPGGAAAGSGLTDAQARMSPRRYGGGWKPCRDAAQAWPGRRTNHAWVCVRARAAQTQLPESRWRLGPERKRPRCEETALRPRPEARGRRESAVPGDGAQTDGPAPCVCPPGRARSSPQPRVPCPPPRTPLGAGGSGLSRLRRWRPGCGGVTAPGPDRAVTGAHGPDAPSGALSALGHGRPSPQVLSRRRSVSAVMTQTSGL